MVEYLAGSSVPRVSVRCLAEWRDGRFVNLFTCLAIFNLTLLEKTSALDLELD